MRVIDRLQLYLKHRHLAPYTFERTCGIANGYLKKQLKGKGTIGSEIIGKITSGYVDLNITWLLTGKGAMLNDDVYASIQNTSTWAEQEMSYSASEQSIKSLKDKIRILEEALNDKEKIIKLLENHLSSK